MKKIILNNHKAISLNQIYQMGHWSKRKELADLIHALVRIECINQKITPVKKYPVKIKVIAYLKRPIDCSNVNIKLYEDGLKIAGTIKDDSPTFVNSVEAVSKKAKGNSLVIEII